ncbi:hypothetical protein Sgly_0354 [Syntrophobotulus glycolicus DSM 8271]|uniref:Uncharacterized protein n=1 Tax=Syntrophobotulus glycolicus (strain DSM 8271 / FlGlyR) TaxID=645991 RepID=F0SXH4_SYNGF|nr:hypothetical protein Sgly_0354 [Syntrophobotulus glycolicus DSM 8271]
MDLEKRIEAMEKKMAALEGQVQKRPEKIILEIDGETLSTVLKKNHD